MSVKTVSRSPARSRRRQAGFTLAELAIVLLVVSILLGGVLMPLSVQVDLRKIGDARKSLDEIREAMIGFALANGRLPCPADPTIADGTANAGVERAACTAGTSMYGAVPWVTLNVPESDPWGRRFNYRVTTLFADSIAAATYGCVPPANPTQSSFALCSSGDMKIQSRNPATKTAYDLTNVALPAVFYSAGKNGYGAYTQYGSLYSAPPASNADETSNATAATVIYFSREKTETSSSCSDTSGTTPMCEFDDIVGWIPLTTLVNRMVVAGKLP